METHAKQLVSEKSGRTTGKIPKKIIFQGNSALIKNNALPEHDKHVTEFCQNLQVTS